MLNPFQNVVRRGFLTGMMVFAVLTATAGRNASGDEPAVSTADIYPTKVTSRQYDITDLVQTEKPVVANLAIVTPAIHPSEPATPSFETLGRDIATKIHNTVAYNTWKNLPPIAVQTTNSSAMLIISQTPDVHGEIAALLEQLRETHQPEVTVDYHLISVGPEAAETAAMLQKKASPAITHAGAPHYYNSFLHANEVEALLKTVGAVKGVEIRDVELNRFRNGHGAFAVQETIIPYIAGIADDGHIRANASTGNLFEVANGISSADHKYITMDVRFQWSHFERFETITSGIDSYQEPIEQFTQFDGRVTVPDRQSMLIAVAPPELLTIKYNAPATRPSADAAQTPLVRPALFLLISPKINPAAPQPATQPSMQ